MKWGHGVDKWAWLTEPLVPRDSIERGEIRCLCSPVPYTQMWFGPWTFAEILEHLERADANGRDGEWRYLQLRLPYDLADVLIDGREVTVPVFLPDPERAGWRRRKWWGRGPIFYRVGYLTLTPRYFYKDDWRTIHPTNCGYVPR